ncbi:hypothetical protein [Cellulomonas sp. KRMCY2]|uniref:hypothetical protein n=1 Tax=Cellulomonas sp. KRMCY2 TaxID=1304865 RepID=UPI00045E7AB6|nr:hypothetical protein [Cellulomonas sp. KRMCY2]
MNEELATGAAVAALVLLTLLALFQLALALGAPLGRVAWGGRHRVLPGRLRVGSAVSILLYALFGTVLADRVGLVDVLPDAVSEVGTWVLAGYFLLGVVMNAVSRSVPERLTMAPVAALLSGACVVIALAAG